MPLKSKKN